MSETGADSSDDPLARRTDPGERLADAIAETRQVLGDLDSTRPTQMDLLFYIGGLTHLRVVSEELLDSLDEFDLHLPPARPALGELPNDEHEHRGHHQPQEGDSQAQTTAPGGVPRMIPGLRDAQQCSGARGANR